MDQQNLAASLMDCATGDPSMAQRIIIYFKTFLAVPVLLILWLFVYTVMKYCLLYTSDAADE